MWYVFDKAVRLWVYFLPMQVFQLVEQKA
jgi:hypothetical protein